MIWILSWESSYEIFLQQKFNSWISMSKLVMTGLGNEMFHKTYLFKFDHYSRILNRVSSFSKVVKLLGYNHGGSAPGKFFLYIHFCLYSSACQILFLGLSSLPGCFKTFKWIPMYIIFWEIFHYYRCLNGSWNQFTEGMLASSVCQQMFLTTLSIIQLKKSIFIMAPSHPTS